MTTPSPLELRAAVMDGREVPPVLARTMLELAPVPLVAIGPNALVVACNPAAAALFGRLRQGLVGLHVKDFVARGARAKIQREVHAALTATAAGEPLPDYFDTFGVRPGAQPFPLRVRMSAASKDGEPVVVLALTDQTAMVEAEQARYQQLDRLLVFADHGFEALVIHRSGVIVQCNQAYADMMRTTIDAIIGKPVLHFAAPEAAASVSRSLSRRRTEPYETLILRSDGTRLPVQVRREEVRYLGRPAFLVGVRDITEEIARRKHLAQSQQRFRLLFERSMDAIFFTVPTGTILEANEAACRMFGMRPEDFKRVGRQGILDESDERWLEALRVRRETGVFAGELRFKRADGSTFPADIVSTVFLDEDGEQRGSIVLRDVSARREAQDRVNQALMAEQLALRKLDELSNAKSQFLSMLSHEFRTALIAIGWLTAPLGSADTAQPQRETLAEQVHSEAARLIRLVDDILELDRMESGRMRLRRGAVDIIELIEPILVPIRMRGRRVVWRTRDGAPVVEGDRDRLSQVFVNLLSNAEKFSPPGTTIWVGAEVVDGAAHLWVRNRSEAIPRDQLATIFERFTRAERADADGTPGTGLGLAIAHDIVELHGGRIWAESTQRTGTTFHVRLPLAEAEAEAGASPGHGAA